MIKAIVALALVAVVSCDVSHLFRKPSNNLLTPFAPNNVRQAAPRPLARAASSYQAGPDANVQILRQDSDINPDGSYQYSFEADNGISVQEQASVQTVSQDQTIKSAQGSFQWTSPEGQSVQISYIADENGYQPQGDLPTPPPIPLAIQRALDWIAAHPQPEEPQRRF